MVDNEFGITDPLYMTQEQLAKKNNHVFNYPYLETQYQHQGYPSKTQLSEEVKKFIDEHLDFRTQSYNDMFKKLEERIKELEKQVTDLNDRLEYLENQNLLAL